MKCDQCGTTTKLLVQVKIEKTGEEEAEGWCVKCVQQAQRNATDWFAKALSQDE